MKGRRVIYLLAAAAAVTAAMVLPATASAANPSCGSTIGTNLTLTGDMDCSASNTDALKVGAAGITINLNGYTLTSQNGYEAVNNQNTCGASGGCSGVTVTNGKIIGGDYGVDSEGNSSHQNSGTTISGVTFDGQQYEAIYLGYTAGSNIAGNTITDSLGNDIDGIDDEYSSSDVINGNTITGYNDLASSNSGTGIYLYYDGGTVVENNTISAQGDYGIEDYEYGAGVGVYSNVLSGNDTGMYLSDNESGWSISGNYVRNSSSDGIEADDADLMTYAGNIVSGNGSDGFDLYNGDYPGTLTVTNNVSRFNGSEGFYMDGYSSDAEYASTNGVWSGNSATYNADYGFEMYYDKGTTLDNNSAWHNGDSGFYLYEPMHYTVTNNSARYNANEGFDVEDNYEPYNVLSFFNNEAQYNTDYGFYGSYPVAGSGNQGYSTNTTADCYQFAGCS
jgi:parallel beta-helix repeat protein